METTASFLEINQKKKYERRYRKIIKLQADDIYWHCHGRFCRPDQYDFMETTASFLEINQKRVRPL